MITTGSVYWLGWVWHSSCIMIITVVRLTVTVRHRHGDLTTSSWTFRVATKRVVDSERSAAAVIRLGVGPLSNHDQSSGGWLGAAIMMEISLNIECHGIYSSCSPFSRPRRSYSPGLWRAALQLGKARTPPRSCRYIYGRLGSRVPDGRARANLVSRHNKLLRTCMQCRYQTVTVLVCQHTITYKWHPQQNQVQSSWLIPFVVY